MALNLLADFLAEDNEEFVENIEAREWPVIFLRSNSPKKQLRIAFPRTQRFDFV